MSSSNSFIRAGIDWGSSSFRAYQFDQDGELVESLELPMGIKYCDQQGFEEVLFDAIGNWLQPDDQILLSGMITSRNGWVESDYLPCPANLRHLVSHATSRIFRKVHCLFLPGVSQYLPADIMRGEELQLLGVQSKTQHYLAVVPGTHSKWIDIRDNTIRSFRTVATGEVYDVLMKHSLLGSFATGDDWDQDVFLEATESGYRSDTILSDLFLCRSAVVLNTLPEKHSSAYLSGLLIGREIREGMKLTHDRDQDIVLIGSEKLTRKYQRVFECLGFSVVLENPESAARGFQQLMRYRDFKP